MAADAEEKRHDVDRGGAIADQASAAVRRSGAISSRKAHATMTAGRLGDAPRHGLERLAPARIARAVREQDDAASCLHR